VRSGDHDTMQVTVIGVASSPYHELEACPPGPQPDGPDVRIAIRPEFREALLGLDRHDAVDVLMWFDRAGGYDLIQTSRTHPEWGPMGAFGLRSPYRPTPIGVSTVELVRVEPDAIVVRGLDCLDQTPIIDIKPAR
jgi:tRNA-Thr(GGU) m(6)t(6)A37 methyltransferase TsaA